MSEEHKEQGPTKLLFRRHRVGVPGRRVVRWIECLARVVRSFAAPRLHSAPSHLACCGQASGGGEPESPALWVSLREALPHYHSHTLSIPPLGISIHLPHGAPRNFNVRVSVATAIDLFVLDAVYVSFSLSLYLHAPSCCRLRSVERWGIFCPSILRLSAIRLLCRLHPTALSPALSISPRL
eukprot:scaffold82946_cov37-Tisochrysis_lutea.AAC.1